MAFQIRDIIMTPGITPPQPSHNIPNTTNTTDAPLASAVVDVPLVRVYNFLRAFLDLLP